MPKLLLLSLLLLVDWALMRSAPQAPAAALTVNGGSSATVYVGETVIFDSSGSTNTVRRTLTSSGVSPAGLEDPYYIPLIPKVAHAFRATGTYTVTVTTYNAAEASDTEQVTVTVNALPTPTGSQLIDMADSGACGGSCYISPGNLTDGAGNKTRFEAGLAAVAALNGSQEAMLKVPAGAKIDGTIFMPVPTGSKYIFITSNGTLPDPWNRATSSDEAQMFEIRATSPGPDDEIAIVLSDTTHHWWFIGMEVVGHATDTGYGLIRPEGTLSEVSDVPHHIVIDRCYLHEGAASTMRTGIYMSLAYSSILNSTIGPFKWNGQETKGVLSVNAPGPITIYNNSIVAGSQAHLSGGVASASATLHPSTHAFRNNRLWHDPSWEGTFNVKYNVEIKQGDNFIYDGNIIEYAWGNPAGAGDLIQLQMYREGAGFGVTEDIQITNSLVRHGGFGINSGAVDGPLTRIIVRNNVFDDINGSTWSPGNGVGIGVNLSGAPSFQLIHNTFLVTGNGGFKMNGNQSTSTVFKDNIFTFTDNAIRDDDSGTYGTSGLNNGLGSYTYANNLIAGDLFGQTYPASTINPSSNTAINFTNYNSGNGGNYVLLSSSPGYQAGSDGADVGANVGVVNSATATVISGAWGASGGGGTPPASRIQVRGKSTFRGKVTTRP
jgi:hypothetical protein